MTVLPVTRIRLRVDSFPQESRLGRRRGGVEDLGQTVGQAPVHLLREGAVDVVGAQAGLDVGHGDHAVERGQCGGEGGGGVAVDHHQVGLLPSSRGSMPLRTAEVMWPRVWRSRMILRSWSTGREKASMT